MSEILGDKIKSKLLQEESFGDKYTRLLNDLQKRLSQEEFNAFDDALMAVERLHGERMELKAQESNEIQANIYRLLKGEKTPDLFNEHDTNRHGHFLKEDQRLAALRPEKINALNEYLNNDVLSDFRLLFLEMINVRQNDLQRADQEISDLRKELSSVISNQKVIDEIRVKLKVLPKLPAANDNAQFENNLAKLNDVPPAAANG